MIARTLGISRNTVRSALAADAPPKYARKPSGSSVDVFEQRIREQLRAVPTMPATVIAERVGWDRGLTVFKTRVAELRPAYLPPDPAGRTTYEAGELAQFDFWFPDIEVPVGYGQTRTAKRLPVMTCASGYSRWAGARLIPSRDAADLYAGWWRLLAEHLQGVPKTLVWDGEGAVGRWRAKQPTDQSGLTLDCQGFRGVLGASVYICKPRDPEAKGIIERFHDYLERSFLPGRTFTSPADFNTQLEAFLAKANVRRMRTLGCTPADRVAADRAAMLPLPPVPPHTGWARTMRLPGNRACRDLRASDWLRPEQAPRMRPLIGVALVAASTAALTMSVTGPAGGAQDGRSGDLSQRSERVQREGEQAEEALTESSAELAKANRRLDAAGADLVAAEVGLRAMTNRLSAAQGRNRALRQSVRKAEARLERARLELARGVAATARQREAVVDMVTANYQGGDPQLAAISSYLVSATAEEVVRRAQANEAMLDRQARVYAELQAAQLLAQAREDDVEEATSELTRRQQQAASSAADLAEVREAAEVAAERLRAAVITRRAATRAATSTQASDLAVLRRVQAREQAIRGDIRMQARRTVESQASAHSGESGGGSLVLPVDGTVTSPYGYRTHPIYQYWGLHDGVDYAAPCGEPLRAAATGVVSTTYYSKVFGYRLFIDVGRVGDTAITLVYNHADGYGVATGDSVSQGEVVGTVGDSGWSTGCHLHFTVLANGSPVDPAGWY